MNPYAISTTHLAENVAAVWTIMEGTGTGIDPAQWAIYNGGTFGFFCIMWMTGLIYSKPQVDRMMKQKDKENEYIRGELTAVNKILEGIRMQLMGQTIPNINSTAQVFERGTEGIMALVQDTHDRLVAMTKNQQEKGDTP